jgi:hypothetical protein
MMPDLVSDHGLVTIELSSVNMLYLTTPVSTVTKKKKKRKSKNRNGSKEVQQREMLVYDPTVWNCTQQTYVKDSRETGVASDKEKIGVEACT